MKLLTKLKEHIKKILFTLFVGGVAFASIGGEGEISVREQKIEDLRLKLASSTLSNFKQHDLKLVKKDELTTTVDTETDEITFSKLDGKLKIKPQTLGGELAIEDKKIKKKHLDVEYHIYEKPDAIELEVVWNKKPISNVIDIPIETEGLDFFYQPELTEEEIEQGHIRPENIVGSYAVYYKDGRKDNEYKTGKFTHIYRPHIVDADGNEVWGEILIENGLMSITVPQEFVDTASYPVKVDPTFGIFNAGGSSGTCINTITGMQFRTPVNFGEISSITASVYAPGSPTGMKSTISDDTLTLVTNGVSDATAFSSGDQVVTTTFSSVPDLAPNTEYYFGSICDGSGTVNIRYDVTVSGYDRFSDGSNSYSSPTSPTDATVVSNIRQSIYVTYTGAASFDTYGYCRVMTVTAGTGGVATTTTNGFALVSTSTLSDLMATSSGGKIQTLNSAQTLPYDLSFTAGSDCDTPGSILDYFIEDYASTTGAYVAHIEVPDISSTTAKTILMWYGLANASDISNEEGVYGSLTERAVYTLSEDPSGTAPQIQDSTSNSIDGTTAGSMTSNDLVDGQIGKAIDYDGVNDVVTLSSNPVLDYTAPHTFCTWFNTSVTSVQQSLVTTSSDLNNNGMLALSSVGIVSFSWESATVTYGGYKSGVFSGNTWTFACGVFDGSSVKIYKDGADVGSLLALHVNSSTNALGRATYNYTGKLDEARIFNRALSAADILTMYNNTVDSSTFWTFGVEETAGGGEPEPEPSTGEIYFIFID